MLVTATKQMKLNGVQTRVLLGTGVLVVAAILIGILAILAGPRAVIVYTGVLVAPVLLVISLQRAISLLVVVSFVITGTLYFFAGVSLATWIPYVLSATLVLRIPTRQIGITSTHSVGTWFPRPLLPSPLPHFL
jgi:hypothetical protein